MRSLTLLLALLILGLAIAHMVVGYMVATLAGLDPLNRPLNALMKMLTFPVQQLPDIFHRTSVATFLSWFLSSLLVSGVLVLGTFSAFQALGVRGGLVSVALLLAALLGVGAWLARPVADWNSTGHRYLQNHVLMLPVPFLESAAEQSAEFAIHENLNPGQPFRMWRNQWFWNHRSGSSGHPSYDAVVVGCETEACPSLADFLAVFSDQREPTMRAAAWQPVTEGPRWRMETALPNRAPLPSREQDRVTRVYAATPAGGVWLGILAREAKMPREQMVSILEGAMDSVRPMAR